jgi:hypothetical protein
MPNCKAYHIFTGTGKRNGVVKKREDGQLQKPVTADIKLEVYISKMKHIGEKIVK